MIHDLKPYPTYVDSGFSELGELPIEWRLLRLRHVVEMRVSNVDKLTNDDEEPVRLCNYVDVYRNDRITDRISFMWATATSAEIDRFHLVIGDVLITKDSEAWNDIGVPSLVTHSAPDLICGYHLALLRPRSGVLAGSYGLHVLGTPFVAHQFHVKAIGVTRYGLSHNSIKDVTIPVPPFSEQVAIARYIDHMDRRMSPYIRAKQKLIGLLEEQKQSIVHHAATRGLDTAVPLKRSGVDWLGDVPEHWDIQRNGQLFVQRNETGFAELPILEVSLRTGVRIRDFDTSDRKQVMSDRGKYKRALKGDIAYNTMRMWQGAAGVAPIDGLVSPAYVVARPRRGTESRYFGHLFRTPAFMGEVDRYSRGIVKDRNRPYWEDFKQMPSPCPPTEEQVRIADAIDERTLAVNETIRQAQREIKLIREYRTRLTADLVTGKLDVREAAVNLPEEIANGEPSLEGAEPFSEDDREDIDLELEVALEKVEP